MRKGVECRKCRLCGWPLATLSCRKNRPHLSPPHAACRHRLNYTTPQRDAALVQHNLCFINDNKSNRVKCAGGLRIKLDLPLMSIYLILFLLSLLKTNLNQINRKSENKLIIKFIRERSYLYFFISYLMYHQQQNKLIYALMHICK